jgi:hypothetical protein
MGIFMFSMSGMRENGFSLSQKDKIDFEKLKNKKGLKNFF